MTKIQNHKPVWALDIEIWNLFVFWCLYFEISDFRACEPKTWNRSNADRKCIDNRQAFFYKCSFEKFSTGPCG